MRWNKALNVLIIMFIVVNIVLGITNYHKYVAAYHISEEHIENIKTILNDKGIILQADVPRSYKPVQPLMLEPLQIEGKLRDQLVEQLFGADTSKLTISKETSTEPYEQSILVYRKEAEELKILGNHVTYANKSITKDTGTMTKEQALAYAKTFVEKVKLENHFKNVKIIHRLESYGASVTYYEVYNQLPIFDSYIHMEITTEGVVNAVMQGVNQIQRMDTIKPLTPVDQVLFDIEEQIEKEPPLTITAIELGYSMNSKAGMQILEEEAVPVYKIDIKGLSEPVFVNAYTK